MIQYYKTPSHIKLLVSANTFGNASCNNKAANWVPWFERHFYNAGWENAYGGSGALLIFVDDDPSTYPHLGRLNIYADKYWGEKIRIITNVGTEDGKFKYIRSIIPVE